MKTTFNQLPPQLSLMIPDDRYSVCSLMVIDNSVYPKGFVAECPRLEITPPGFKYAIEVPIDNIGFSKVITACDLGLQTQNCDKVLTPLQDGIYVIKYSIAPHDTYFAEYYYMRTSIMTRYLNHLLCCIDKVKIYDADYELISKEIFDIWMAKNSTELMCDYYHEVDGVMKEYNRIMQRINKLMCRYCDCGKEIEIGCFEQKGQTPSPCSKC